jgi:hypothetical protein
MVLITADGAVFKTSASYVKRTGGVATESVGPSVRQ